MTLNASGPISLGGSTLGQSVNLEIGASDTAQVSFNDPSVRRLTETASGTSISMPADFWGKTGIPAVSNFLAGYYSSGWKYPSVIGSLVDSSNNVYIYGSETGEYNLWVAKFNSKGTLQWQKSYSKIYVSNEGSGCIDSSDNLYFIGTDGSSYKFAYTLKIDSTGAVVYFTQLATPAAWNFTAAIAIRISPSGEPVGLFRMQNTSTYEIPGLVVKFNTDLTVNWQRYFVGSSGGNFIGGTDLYIDSGNTIYVLGNAYYLFVNYTVLVKIDTSGIVNWSYYYQGSSSAGAGTSMVFGPAASGADVYVVGTYLDPSSNYTLFLGKINTSTAASTISLGYTYVGSALYSPGRVTQDSSGNLYVLTTRGTSTPNNYVLMKFDSSLTLTYQAMYSRQYVGVTNYYPSFYGIASNGNSIVLGGGGGNVTSGPSINSAGALMLQVPNDNSLTGTITYEASPQGSTTISSASLTQISYSLYTQGSWTYLSSFSLGPCSLYVTTTTTTTTTWPVERTLQ